MMVRDMYGNTVQFSDFPVDDKCKSSIDRMLYIKDSFMIADKAYQEMSLEGESLPSLYALHTRMKELNSLFTVQVLPNGKGVQEKLEGKL